MGQAANKSTLPREGHEHFDREAGILLCFRREAAMNEKENQDVKPNQEEDILLQLATLRLNVGALFIFVEEIQRRMQKWDEVYYHVFPDRFEKDMEFERQLHALNCPPKPDDRKKS
jgi:hypothetical protein